MRGCIVNSGVEEAVKVWVLFLGGSHGAAHHIISSLPPPSLVHGWKNFNICVPGLKQPIVPSVLKPASLSWSSLSPPNIMIALSNGRYKSCMHRALVNAYRERRSLVFCVCPREDKVVRPPEILLSKNEQGKYPDFTWSNLFEFTQKHYRADVATLQNFFQWHRSSKPSSLF